jgi:26S proteasome non-ATPase regulatory subunit 9
MTLLNGDSPMERARTLMARKDAIELEIETQFSILKAQNVTMESTLVDGDGFPRTDIDVWAVRTARVKVIELNNDLRGVVDAIGKALEGVYATTGARESPTPSSQASPMPFAKVESVAPGSPAAEAVRIFSRSFCRLTPSFRT